MLNKLNSFRTCYIVSLACMLGYAIAMLWVFGGYGVR